MTDKPTKKACLHCLVMETIRLYTENLYEQTGETVGLLGILDDLMCNVSELIAFIPDAQERKEYTKETADLLLLMVPKFREIGRYPGEEWMQKVEVE